MKKIFLLFFSFCFVTALVAQETDDTEKEKLYTITSLTKKADNPKYGLSSDQPVKVGKGINGGPANQRAYLDLLRDEQGRPVKYERQGSCCAYASENGFMGYAMVDIYEVVHFNEKGKKQKTKIYISFYDYEEPMIPAGFKTIE